VTRPRTAIGRLACRVRLGLADWREVEQAGLGELAVGSSKPEVVALAAVTAGTLDLEALVDSAVAAIGEPVPNEVEAARVVALDASVDIVAGAVAPIVGARALWRLARRVSEVEPELRQFVGLASEWEDDEANRSAYDEDIVEAARQLIEALKAEPA